MLTCQECKARMYPENPSQPFYLNGRYLRPICETCPNYEETHQDREPKPQEQVVIHRHSDMSKQDWDLLQQTALRVKHLEGKLSERRRSKGEY